MTIRKKTAVFSVLTALLLICAAEGRGETWKEAQLRRQWEKAAWRIGPFRVQPYVHISDAGYDSNVYHRPDETSDYWFTAGPGFDVYLPIKNRLLVQAHASPRYVYFKETVQERAWNYYADGRVHLFFRKYLISAGAGWSDVQERRDSEIDIRPRRTREYASAAILWQPTRRTSFEAAARRERFDYEDVDFFGFNLRERLNRDETYATATAFLRLSFRTTAFVAGEYGTYDFENPLLRSDAESRAVYGGFEFSPFGRIRGQVRLGYKELALRDEEGSAFRGYVGDTSVSAAIHRNLTLRGFHRRDVRFSLWHGNPYYLENRTGGGVSVYMFRGKVRADGNYMEGTNTYPSIGPHGGEANGGLAAEARKDRFLLRSIGLYYRLKENIGIGVAAGRWDRDTNIPGLSVKREFVHMTLTYDFE